MKFSSIDCQIFTQTIRRIKAKTSNECSHSSREKAQKSPCKSTDLCSLLFKTIVFNDWQDSTHNLPEQPISLNELHASHRQQQTVTDLVEKLSIKNVIDLVLASMRSLPETIPLSFQSAYTAIQDAGSPVQIEHLAHLLNNQLIAAGYDLVKSHQVMTHCDRKLTFKVSLAC